MTCLNSRDNFRSQKLTDETFEPVIIIKKWSQIKKNILTLLKIHYMTS